MTVIAADIGGTHARFAVIRNDVPENPVRMAARDHASLADALAAYCAKVGAKPEGTLLTATAARAWDDGTWRFLNGNDWIIDAAALKARGWNASLIVNDFVASARGSVNLPDSSLQVLKQGRGTPGAPRAVLGPGTGLGLAYVAPVGINQWRVQETFGGHMLAAFATEEQARIAALVKDFRGGPHIIVPEDLASGRALYPLYQAVCLDSGRAPVCERQEDLLSRPADEDVSRVLRLFHEYLGLFAHQAVITGHAFGGLYLDGGMVHRLNDAGLFEFAAMGKFLDLDVVPTVKEKLSALPVWLVRDPFVALRGLAAMKAANNA